MFASSKSHEPTGFRPHRVRPLLLAVAAFLTATAVASAAVSILRADPPPRPRASSVTSASAGIGVGPNAGSQWQHTVLAIDLPWERGAAGSQAYISAVDLGGTPTELGTATTAYSPLVLLRASHGEVLASSYNKENDLAVLRVLDLADGLKEKSAIPLPNRIHPMYMTTDSMVLSGDEHWLYYVAVFPSCTGDASACDQVYVRVVDLGTLENVATIPIQQGCGWPSLVADGLESMLVVCADSGKLFRVGADGGSVLLASVPLPARTTVGSGHQVPPRAVYGGVTADGSRFMVFSTGVMKLVSPDGDVTQRVLVTGQALSGLKTFRLDSNRVIFGYNNDGSPYIDGAVLFDERTMDAVVEVPLPPRTTYVLGIGDHLATLHEGVISEQDFAGNPLGVDFTPTRDTAALIGVYSAPPGGY